MDKIVYISLDEQLYRNYNELYSLIMQCYKDISILKVYMKFKIEEYELYNMTPNISNHIVRSTQMELALTLWKIYFDKNRKSNTIPKFRNSINEKLRKSDNGDIQIDKAKINKGVEDKLNSMRREFLAHVDMTRSDSRIEISDLSDLLEVICKEFNDICSVVDDERVNDISEIDIAIQDVKYRVELLALYNRKMCDE